MPLQGAVLVFSMCLASAQETPADQCTISILNQTANVRPDGTFFIPNVPANMGPVRARMTCVRGGETLSGTSELFTIAANRMNALTAIELGVGSPTPQSIEISSPAPGLGAEGETLALSVVAAFADSTTQDVTAAEAGTVYFSTNPAVASVSAEGVVTALASGNVLVSALNEAILDSISIRVVLGGDRDGDGLPDDFELANGLDPNDPVDAFEDADGDTLTNLEEFLLGTGVRNPDSDGDGIGDGEELSAANGFVTSPLLFDSDGDGVWDGLEIEVLTDPTSAASVDYALVLEAVDIEQAAINLLVNTVLARDVSALLRVRGSMIDGNTLELTAGRGTAYGSSDLGIANFGAEDGRVFAGGNGVATVTASNSGFSATVEVAVSSFAPTALSSIGIPGYANNVEVAGGFAFVAAGATGLQVVDVFDPSAPAIVGSVNTPGNANDIRVQGGLAYVADGSAGLQIIDVSVPGAPQLLGALETPGVATDLVVAGGRAYVADGAEGVHVIDVSVPSAPVLLGSVDTPGDAQGIDVSGTLVVVADGRSGVHIIDVSDPAQPSIVGSTHTRNFTSQAADVVVRGSLAFVADGANTSLGGLRVIDFSNPSTPFVAGTTGNRFGLTAVALDGDLALAADFFFFNEVPVFDVSVPNPAIRGSVDFRSFSDDNGTGIDLQRGLVYLTGAKGVQNNGVAGSSRLLIGRYAILSDNLGVSPSVELTAPLSAQIVRERSRITLSADARDDVRVDSVAFFVGGELVFTDFTSPYGVSVTVPVGVTTLTLSAIATDLGGNRSPAEEVSIVVIPDTSPTLELTSPTQGSVATEGTTIQATANATDDVEVAKVEFFVNGALELTLLTPPYRLGIPVPLGASSLTLTATATDSVGQTESVTRIVQVDPDGPPSALLVQPRPGTSIVEGSDVRIVVGASDDVGVASVELIVDGVSRFTDTIAPYLLDFTVPLGATDLRITAIVRDTRGQQILVPEVTLAVVPDPATTVQGIVRLPDRSPAVGATVTVIDRTATTDAQGLFSVVGVPTARGLLVARARLLSFAGTSDVSFPVGGGVTDVGEILLAQEAPTATLALVTLEPTSDIEIPGVVLVNTLTQQIENESFPATFELVQAAAIAPGGQVGVVTVFAIFESGLRILDLTAQPPDLDDVIVPTPPVVPSDLVVTPDGRFAVVSGSGPDIAVVDLQLRSVVSFANLGPSRTFLSVEITPDGSRVLVLSSRADDVSVFAIDAAGGLTSAQPAIPLQTTAFAPFNLVVTPNGRRAFVTDSAQARVIILDLTGPTVTRLGALAGLPCFSTSITGIAITPDGSKVYVSSVQDQALAVLSVEAGDTLVDTGRRIPLPAGAPKARFGIPGLAVTPDGRRLYVASSGQISIVNVDSDTLLADTIPTPEGSSPVSIGMGGR